MNAHSQIEAAKPAEQLDLIDSANGGARAPTEDQARAILINGMRDFMSRFKPTTADEAVQWEAMEDDNAMQSILDDMLAKIGPMSPGSVGEIAGGKSLVRLCDEVRKVSALADAKTAGGDCWALPRQDRVEVYATNDDTIEIVQISPMGESEDVRIDIARANAVALARRIIFAVGFSGLCLGGAVNGRGFYDLHDGSLPEHFDGFYESDEDEGAAE